MDKNAYERSKLEWLLRNSTRETHRPNSKETGLEIPEVSVDLMKLHRRVPAISFWQVNDIEGYIHFAGESKR